MQSSLVATGSELGVVRIVETAAVNLTVAFRARLGQGPITGLAISPDAKMLAVATDNRQGIQLFCADETHTVAAEVKFGWTRAMAQSCAGMIACMY